MCRFVLSVEVLVLVLRLVVVVVLAGGACCICGGSGPVVRIGFLSA